MTPVHPGNPKNKSNYSSSFTNEESQEPTMPQQCKENIYFKPWSFFLIHSLNGMLCADICVLVRIEKIITVG